jgi:hypothetical protein
MSNLEEALERLGFLSLDEITGDKLKKSFKQKVLQIHPDKNESDYHQQFDELLSSYSLVSKVLKRLSGGRNQLQQNILVEDVKENRDQQFMNELNNLVSDIYDSLNTTTDHSEFNNRFNEEFEKYREREKEKGVWLENDKGYDDWFRVKDEKEESDTIFTQDDSREAFFSYFWKDYEKKSGTNKNFPPKMKEEDLNKMFEYSVKCGKAEPTALILHPDEMAFSTARVPGTALIQSTIDNFTSELEANPEYTDLKSAYTNDNTYFDKLPSYKEQMRTFEELLKEREIEYKTELDRDLEAIANYEKRKMEEEKEHKKNLLNYFQSTASSKWALSSNEEKKEDTFIKQISPPTPSEKN